MVAETGAPSGVARVCLNAAAALVLGVAFALNAAAAALGINSGFSGAWYDPQQGGHGLFLEVLPPNNLLAWWFTLTPDGTQQAWFGGAGTINGNTATVPVDLTTGGRWVPNFDPTKVVNQPWGTFTFTFTDCNTGRVDYTSSSPGYGSNHLSLTRLTMPAGLTCAAIPIGGSAKGIWAERRTSMRR